MTSSRRRLLSAMHLGGLTFREVCLRTWTKINEHEILTRAAAISFYALAALVPFLALVIALPPGPPMTGNKGDYCPLLCRHATMAAIGELTTVAMESTGVYWIPLFEILQQRGIRPCLVNARHMKNVPGRRTDWHECQWLQFLHSVGLLRAAFRPGQDVCAVRTVLRHRNELVSAASQHVQHMHKALTQMNLQIHHVISDITGLTGCAIVDAILAGQRDGAELAKLRDPPIKADTETIRKSLEGNWRPEHLFTLRQSRDLYRIYQQQIVNCDLEVEKMLREFEPRTDPTERPLPPDRKRYRGGSKRRKKNGHPHPKFDMRTETYKLFGVDVTQIPGLEENALPLFSEVGRDMSRWPSAAHFVSWLALCPDNDISGGKLLWRGARKVKNRAGHLFRMAAFSLHHSRTPLGNYLRRMKAKLGPEAATMATAHKIAVIFYTMVKNLGDSGSMPSLSEPGRFRNNGLDMGSF